MELPYLDPSQLQAMATHTGDEKPCELGKVCSRHVFKPPVYTYAADWLLEASEILHNADGLQGI